jgi:peptidoglycan/xylan/chitin deacetylase (PgdA/CDA1 family)
MGRPLTAAALVLGKANLQRLLRAGHVALASQTLPERVALYGHSVASRDLGALEACAAYFLAQGYRFCGPGEFLAEAGGKRVFLSFDDNYRVWLELMEPLGRLGIAVGFYVNTLPMRDGASPAEIAAYYDRICHGGDRTPLSWPELREIKGMGHFVGCHGHAHLPLTQVPMDVALDDIHRGKDLLENHLGQSVVHFSYPFGMRRFFSGSLREACQDLGFETIVTGIPGMQHAGKDPLNLHRTPWDFGQSLAYNLDNLRVDGRLFQALTGRSAVG